MREILYSPGYGAGWTSWHRSASKEELLFMLEYPPLITALKMPTNEVKHPSQALQDLGLREPHSENVLEALEQFIKEYKDNWPNADLPYLGGARDLQVASVYGLVKINEYDGSESYTEIDDREGYL